MGEFAFFTMRVQRPPGDLPVSAVSGVLEELGTGQKRTFADAAELLELLCGRPGASLKMHPGDASGNAAT